MADAGPAGTVELVVEDPRWRAVGLAGLAERAARAALGEAGRDPDRHEISLLACGDARIAELNGAFRGQARATNVLSWPACSGAPPEPDTGERLFLGDLALAFETCSAEAEAAGIGVAEHAAHLVVHGVLHLLGHDHADDAEATRMEIIEVKALASMGIANPYSR